MLAPMVFFALLCLLIGVAPQLALRLVSPAIESLYPQLALTVVSAEYGIVMKNLSLAGILLLSVAIAVMLFWKWRMGKAWVTSAPTWGCGYQRGTARMESPLP